MVEQQLRADARRNRDRLLAVAASAFSTDGADTSLEAIAREAGVGIGTLYRHYPTREALVEAAYRNELARLCDSAATLLESIPPEAALRDWMRRFVEFMATKHGMAEALRVVIASGANPFAQSRTRAIAAIALLLDAAGIPVSRIDPLDVLTALNGFSLALLEPAQTDRLIELLMEGMLRRL